MVYFRNPVQKDFFASHYKKERIYLGNEKSMENFKDRRYLKRHKKEKENGTYIPDFLEEKYGLSGDLLDKVDKIYSHNCSRGRRYEIVKEIRPELERENVPETIIKNMENGNFKYNDFGKMNVPAAAISLFGALVMVGAAASVMLYEKNEKKEVKIYGEDMEKSINSSAEKTRTEQDSYKIMPIAINFSTQRSPSIDEKNIVYIENYIKGNDVISNVVLKKAGIDGNLGTDDDNKTILQEGNELTDYKDLKIFKNMVLIVKEEFSKTGENAKWQDYLCLIKAGTDGNLGTTDDKVIYFKMDKDVSSSLLTEKKIVWTSYDKENNKLFFSVRDVGADNELGTGDDIVSSSTANKDTFKIANSIYESNITYMSGKILSQTETESDIYLKDIGIDQKIGTSDDKDIPICTAEGLQTCPVIYKDKIAWLDGRYDPSKSGSSLLLGGNIYDIYMKGAGHDGNFGTLDDENETLIYDGHNAKELSLYEDTLVWQAGGQLYMKNLKTGEKATLTSEWTNHNPQICKNNIVFNRGYSDDYDIFLIDLEQKVDHANNPPVIGELDKKEFTIGPAQKIATSVVNDPEGDQIFVNAILTNMGHKSLEIKDNSIWLYETDKKATCNYCLLVQAKDKSGNYVEKWLNFTLKSNPPNFLNLPKKIEVKTGAKEGTTLFELGDIVKDKDNDTIYFFTEDVGKDDLITVIPSRPCASFYIPRYYEPAVALSRNIVEQDIGEHEVCVRAYDYDPSNNLVKEIDRFNTTGCFILKVVPTGSANQPNDTIPQPEPKNNPPKFMDFPSTINAEVGKRFYLDVNATDPGGDAIEFQEDSALFDIDSKTGVVDWIPKEKDIGEYKIIFAVSDGKDITTKECKLIVNGKDSEPNISAPTGSNASGTSYDTGSADANKNAKISEDNLNGLLPYLAIAAAGAAGAGGYIVIRKRRKGNVKKEDMNYEAKEEIIDGKSEDEEKIDYKDKKTEKKKPKMIEPAITPDMMKYVEENMGKYKEDGLEKVLKGANYTDEQIERCMEKASEKKKALDFDLKKEGKVEEGSCKTGKDEKDDIEYDMHIDFSDEKLKDKKEDSKYNTDENLADEEDKIFDFET